MTPDSVRERLVLLLSERDEFFDEPGDRWLIRPNPDEASLAVDHLADALTDLFIELHKVSFA